MNNEAPAAPAAEANNRQYLSNIKDITAVNGRIRLEVYPKGAVKDGVRDLGAPVRSVVLALPQARERAEAMVVIASRLSAEEAKSILDVVRVLLAKIEEAEKQKLQLNQPA